MFTLCSSLHSFLLHFILIPSLCAFVVENIDVQRGYVPYPRLPRESGGARMWSRLLALTLSAAAIPPVTPVCIPQNFFEKNTGLEAGKQVPSHK